MATDPGKTNNAALQHPDLLQTLSANYECWRQAAQPDYVNKHAHRSAPAINPHKDRYWRQYQGLGPNHAPPSANWRL